MIVTTFAVIGCIASVWYTIRVGATAVDVFQRWQRSRAGDPNAWD